MVERVELCRRAFVLCMERDEEIAQMITREVGKTIRESREEMVEFTADHFRRASEDVLRHAGKVLPSTQERTNAKRILIVQEPVGVVAAVSPVELPGRHRRHPDRLRPRGRLHGRLEAVRVRAALREHVRRGPPRRRLPAGTINVVHGRGEVGQSLVTHPEVGSVVFTGSVETGEKVARDAGLKNRVLELGGNGPQIVLADADIERRRMRRSSAASTSPGSAAPRRSGSSFTSR